MKPKEEDMGWERIGRKPRSFVQSDELVVKVVGKDKQTLTIMMGLELIEKAGFEGNETVDLVIGTDQHVGLCKLARDDRGAQLQHKNNRVDFKTSRVPPHMSTMKTRRTEIISIDEGEIVFKVGSK